jgi:Na+-transporting methylmalonyl-CoA/oxaloacetate decarboxylase gamma subunit
VLNATWFVLAGMGIVFATLSILALAMTALNRWLGPEVTGQAKGRTTRTGRA